MAADSKTSVQNVKKVIGVEKRLQIVQQALADLNTEGIAVRVSTFYGSHDEHNIVIVLSGIELEDGNLVIASTGKEPQ